jgi:DNA-binding protein Fis
VPIVKQYQSVQLSPALIRNVTRRSLEQAGNNKSQAARLLGLTRHTLRYRMEKHGLE